MSDRSRGAVLREVLLLWLGTLLIVRLVHSAAEAGAPELLKAAAPILFMYAPVWWMQRRGEDPDRYPLALPAFNDARPYLEALRLNAWVIGLVAVPFVLGYHLWQTEGLPAAMELVGFSERRILRFEYQGTWPENMALLIAYHLFFTAIPEEMFYRGYMQSRLDEIWPPRWKVFGTEVGWGLVASSFIFAIGHSIVVLQWWHPFIFFPSLVFGWMRSRTGAIVAGAIFHAWCNVTVTTLDTLYGIVPP
ncbi:MAG: CPBP family intramembrane metalloprotease [Deltaproteobacteria bacterium]|nr:MAG: CPBP family intramembrane metalloprotease [Deltaproteobacteria bacterium]